MRIPRLITRLAIPATIGAGCGYLAQQMGYDMSALEGIKQVIPTALALEGLFRSPDVFTCSQGELEAMDLAEEFREEHPKLHNLLNTTFTSGLYPLAGMGLEALTGKDVNLGFLSLAGAVSGIISSTYGDYKRRKQDQEELNS